MAERLTIHNFAGLKDVSLAPSQITVLIGPTASGKSVLAKLLYFFRGVWQQIYFTQNPEDTLEFRKELVKAKFKKYFPIEAWGKSMFNLTYEVGDHRISLRRGPSKGKPSEGLILSLPEFVGELYQSDIETLRATFSSGSPRQEPFLIAYKLWEQAEIRLHQFLGKDYFTGQLFVPAGRAFFSNIESNVFSFIARGESKLDPFLAEFGEFYTYFRNQMLRRSQQSQLEDAFSRSMLKGRLVVEREREYVQCDDGRKLALANLSSGQQELLPLLSAMSVSARHVSGNVKANAATYIEEPEAHLFPEAQRLTIEHIASWAQSAVTGRALLLTTHSPYVLSAINNLLFAGQLGDGASKERQNAVNTIVAKEQWIAPGTVAAFGLQDGSIRDILDSETGLVDAIYIDSVSTDIGRVFDRLLQLSLSTTSTGDKNVRS